MSKMSKMSLLTDIFKNTNNITLFEELINEKSGNNMTKKIELIYELCGLITQYNIQECYDIIKEDRVEWKLDIFKDDIEEEQVEMDFIDHPFESVDSILECKCGSKKVLSFAKQTRSCDEGTTVFAKCLDCKRKWIESG